MEVEPEALGSKKAEAAARKALDERKARTRAENNEGELGDDLSKLLVSKGLLIEAGWIGLRSAAIPPDAPQVQIDEMRNAFFAGAQHLFSTLLHILDPEDEVTDADMMAMSNIKEELDLFIDAFKKRHAARPGGQ